MEKENLTIDEKKRQNYLLDKEIELKWQKSAIKQELLTSIFFIIFQFYVNCFKYKKR